MTRPTWMDASISMILYDGNYKTGHSFKHVGHMHMVGLISNQADLKQAVARSIRFCGHRDVPMVEGGGWVVNLYIYRPYFNRLGDFNRATDSIQDLLHSLGGSGENDVKILAMRRLMKSCAVDRILNEYVNNESDRITDALTLEDPDLIGTKTLDAAVV